MLFIASSIALIPGDQVTEIWYRHEDKQSHRISVFKDVLEYKLIAQELTSLFVLTHWLVSGLGCAHQGM
jgi:hypothetical protein